MSPLESSAGLSAFRHVRRYALDFTLPATHLFMLANLAKYGAFASALREVVPGQNVLDIGSGSGVLALLSASLGAKRVVALERPSVAHITNLVLDRFPEFRDRVEIIESDSFEWCFRNQEFGVIISETIGYLGFEENLAPILADARERYGSPNSMLIPSLLQLVMSPINQQMSLSDNSPFLATDTSNTLKLEPVRQTKPFRLGTYPSDHMVIEAEWRSLTLGRMTGLAIAFEAELVTGINVTNESSEFWPRCIIPLPTGIQLGVGSRINAALSLVPNQDSYSAELNIHVDNVLALALNFRTDSLCSPLLGLSDIKPEAVVQAVDRILKFAGDGANAYGGVAALHSKLSRTGSTNTWAD